MTSCPKCGGHKVRALAPKRRYEFRGFRDIIVHDVMVESCPHCGHSELASPDIDLLHQAVANAIIAKPHRLRPQEIRFLRKHLGLSAVSFATHVGATPESVSRWENGRTPIGVMTDRLLRLMVVVAAGTPYALKALRTVARLEPTSTPIHVRRREDRWEASTRDGLKARLACARRMRNQRDEGSVLIFSGNTDHEGRKNLRRHAKVDDPDLAPAW